MSSMTRPHGRLPARVYWFRRALVVVTAFALVFGIGRLLGGGADGSGGGPGQGSGAAEPAAAHPTTSAPSRPIGPVSVIPKGKHPKRKGRPASAKGAPLAEPTGDCAVDELTVRAALDIAHAGDEITVPLELTGTQAACRFHVSPRTVVLKITSGSDRIWSSQDCPRSIQPQDVVVRSAQPTTVEVVWHGRRSDEGCPGGTTWAMPGWYHAVSAAIGSEPSDTQFQLTLPNRQVITRTASPKPRKQH